MCQKRTDSQKPLSGAWAKVQGHATAQLQLSNQSPTMCQLGLSVMKDSLCHNPGMTEGTSVVQEQLQQLQRWRDGCTMYKDLREFIEAVEQLGALRRVDGANPQFEIGAITEVAAGRPGGPALLFDDIKGFPRGFRILTNAVTSAPRAALALGLDPSM